MSNNSKPRKIPVQLTADGFIMERPVISATCSDANLSVDKKKEDAEKPLYIKRV